MKVISNSKIIFLGQAQLVFNIAKTASYVLQVKNPRALPTENAFERGKTGLGGRQKAEFSDEQMEHFKGKRVDYLKWGNLNSNT